MADQEETDGASSGAGEKTPGASEAVNPQAIEPPPADPVATPTVKDETAGNGATQTRESANKGTITQQALVDRIKTSDRWMISLTAALVFASLLQWCELHSSGGDTHTLAVATNNLASAEQRQETDTNNLVTAAKAQAQATNSLAEATRNLLSTGKDQAGAAKSEATAMDRLRLAGESQAAAARTQAAAVRSSADATGRLAVSGSEQATVANKALLNADRPWAGPLMPDGNPALQVGQDYVANFQLVNSGRSPALNVTPNITIDIVGGHDDIAPVGKCHANCQQYTSFPGGAITFHPTIDASKMTADTVAALKAKTKFIVVRTRFDYVDPYGRPHESWSCSFYAVIVNGYTSCPTGNGAN